MQKDQLIESLGFTAFLTDVSELRNSHLEFMDIEKLGVDKVYFSDNKPAALFVDVDSFDPDTLLRINRIQNNAWNYRKVLFLFVQSPTEIRVYNCYEKPVFLRKDECDSKVEQEIKKLELIQCSDNSDQCTLDTFLTIFSRIGIDCGYIWTAEKFKDKINLQHRLDKYLVTVLSETADKLEKNGLPKDIIHGLLIRSLFILFLEDKGAAKEAGLYESISEGCDSYFDILKDKEATYLLFKKLQSHFNGNITPLIPNEEKIVSAEHLNLVRSCFMDGDVSCDPTLFTDWRLFNFKIIQVELISEIYELFLGALKHERGQYYTPHGLVDLILGDKLPIANSNYNVKILDLACGSGIFLVESYRRLIARWKYQNQTDKISFSELTKLLRNNIFGIEIDSTAIKVTAFSLYIALIDELDPKTLWIRDDCRLPYLIYEKDDPYSEHNGKNLFRMDTIVDVNIDMLPEINLVVGNPPFSKKKVSDSIKEYCKYQGFATETVLPFIHKSVQFCPKGDIALIFNTKILTDTNKLYCRFRDWLFKKNYVEKLYNLSILRKTPKKFGGQLFNSATGPISIIYFKHEQPAVISDTIEYWAPKTYIRSNSVDGVVINDNDICHLPRTECQNPQTKIWKVAQWGNFSCYRLLEKLHNKNENLKQIFKKDEWIVGRGLNADREHPDIMPEEMIKIDGIDRYYTNPENVCIINKTKYRKNKEGIFSAPFILFKQGLHRTEIACTLFDKSWCCTTGAYVINGGSLDDKKFLVAYLNSDLVKFQLFLTTSCWGVEREIILLNELLELPSPFVSGYEEEKKHIVISFNKIVSIKKSMLHDTQEIKKLEQNINKAFVRLFGISENDDILINDVLKYNLDLFKNGGKSIGFHGTLYNENLIYANTICKALNTFLDNSSIKASATIYDLNSNDPLNILNIYFGQTSNSVEKRNLLDCKKILLKIDKILLEERSPSIYMQKNLKYYDGDNVYLIKPNQKRFWTRSQAEEDAIALITDIMNLNK